MNLLLEDDPPAKLGGLSNLAKLLNNTYAGAVEASMDPRTPLSLSHDFDGDINFSDQMDNFVMTTLNPLSNKYDPKA